jgi:L-alanine-DL-glutamate epimerase-like enolase superfamily enzyme
VSKKTVPDVAVERLEVSAYTVPTDSPESDGTLRWDSTTIILVEVAGGGETGLGYTYGDVSVGKLIESKLAGLVEGRDAMNVQASWAAMQHALRNVGTPGVGSMAVAAVDTALWDLKAKLFDLPLATLLGRFHEGVPVYGSGGFTSYSEDRLQEQLSGWVEEGILRVKMKVGREPQADPGRVHAAREAIGDGVGLMVDANGAYTRKAALFYAEKFAELGVEWFEEPVSSDDLPGLRLIRDRGPAGMAVAAGEYGYDLFYFRSMLEAGAVDVLQADVTRCAGITELLRVDALCKARSLPFSAHTAPQIHAHACCAMETLVHVEYFHDHSRLERMLFDGALEPEGGRLTPDPSRLGLGIELKRADAERYAA